MIETAVEEKKISNEITDPVLPPEIDGVELRSEELQEMLTRPPAWLTRWGAALFSGLLCLIILLSWFIKSPDKITGTFTLTTENPPIELSSRNSGKIQKLFVRDNQPVNHNDIIAEIENPMGIEGVRYLESLISQIQNYVTGKVDDRGIHVESTLTFGDAQADYNNLIKNYQDHIELVSNPFHKERVRELRDQLNWQTELLAINRNQSTIFESQLKNAKTRFAIEEKLYQEKVNSDVEYIQQQDAWLEKLMQNENYKKAIVQGGMTISDLKKQIRQLEFEFEEKLRANKLAMLESIKNLKNYITKWQQTYTVRATSAGMLSYLKPLYNNQYVKAEDALFAIVQDQGDYVAFAIVNSTGAGKVKKGQRVRLKLDNYPYQQFGSIDGVVRDISLLPQASETSANESGEVAKSSYRVTIGLANKLMTNYDVQLNFKPNMTGQAEILTDDLRLLERVFYNVRKAIDQ
jgi:HlyD family secretion protein